MNYKIKNILHWAFIVAVWCWVLISTARVGQWGLFWLNAGAILFALLFGLLGPLFDDKTRRSVLKNMTEDERASLYSLQEQTGKRLGLMVAPFAFLIPFSGMLFGWPSLIYTVPPSLVVLVVLCLPLRRAMKEQTDAMLLATTFAQKNGIKTFRKNSQQKAGEQGD